MIKLTIPVDNISRKNVSELHAALKTLKFDLVDDEVVRKKFGSTTTNAIKAVQKKHKLKVTGKLDSETLQVINNDLFDTYHTKSKTRTHRLHSLLAKLDISVDKGEMISREAGETTRNAIKTFQKKAGMQADGRLNDAVLEALQNDVIKKTYSTKTQIGLLHKTLNKVNSIAKLDVEISQDELSGKALGVSSAKLIKAIQKKYKLPETGEIDKHTLEKLNSVATSRGTYVKKLKVTSPQELKAVTKTLRLNMISPQIPEEISYSSVVFW